MAENEKLRFRRGLAKIHIAEVTADNETEYKTGTIKRLLAAAEMTVTVDQEKTVVWLDNAPVLTIGREGNSEISVTGSALRDAIIAEIFAKDIDETTGLILDSGEFKEKYYALGAEIGNYGENPSLVWFLKTSFSIPDEASKTEDESTDYNGSDLTITAQKTVHKFGESGKEKPCKRVVLDPDKSKLTEGGDWFAQVVTPDNMATVCEKVTATA